MQVMDDRKRLSEIVEISIPSSQMEPAVGSHRRHNATSRELFPLPVLPQIPTLCPRLDFERNTIEHKRELGSVSHL